MIESTGFTEHICYTSQSTFEQIVTLANHHMTSKHYSLAKVNNITCDTVEFQVMFLRFVLLYELYRVISIVIQALENRP